MNARDALEAHMVHESDEDAAEFGKRLDALRAEDLQAAANWLMSKGHTIAARDLDSYIDGGAR